MTSKGAVVGLTLDAGALIAIDRGDERMIALIRSAQRKALPLTVPAGALAQAWRGGASQARLAGFLRTRRDPPAVAPLDGRVARAAGELCGRTRTSDVIDASVVLAARARRQHIVTSDPDDLGRLDPGAPLITI